LQQARRVHGARRRVSFTDGGRVAGLFLRAAARRRGNAAFPARIPAFPAFSAALPSPSAFLLPGG